MPTPPIARRRTRRGWPTTACARASTARSRRAGRCRRGHHVRTRPDPLCARRSSACSPARKARWRCSSAPSASPAPRPGSASPTSPTTCSAWPGSTGNVRLDDKTEPQKHNRPDKNQANIRQIRQNPTTPAYPPDSPRRYRPQINVFRGVQVPDWPRFNDFAQRPLFNIIGSEAYIAPYIYSFKNSD